ncbi:UvrD-helicase domain-containing protein [Phytobacter diazotrophicus]|uniref:UvrD-helicase domain-containing protein n=1 Tax=Phytobacter diazotrophicus TaxID=395631 RepID=UPI0026BB2D3B|nr:UvrD-helicase domain-containing protein [Phytobacter diazotrophicus]MDV2903551.1 UvrD-helicase domain-containing protein [Phytobacter diazotrophicus]
MIFDNLIRERDITWASELMGLGPDGFAPVDGDDSRLRAMLSLDSVDFEACPGSGKTTLLVAKLAIMALRWPSRQQGICVLSHTNAARNEINAKLSNSTAGVSLSRYPHFVGTIHSFINEYLALPWLRSKGIKVRCIDTQIALMKRWFMLTGEVRRTLQRNGLSEIYLAYTKSDYSGGKTVRFGPHTPTYQALLEARRAGSEQGFFCFDEMFVWANELLDMRPETAMDLRQRFPLVLIDEAQDNSEEQSALLHRIFRAGDSPSVRQRFGDSNQAIYTRAGLVGAKTDPFPGPDIHPISRSYRFSQEIADKVTGFGVTPQALIGAGPPPHINAWPQPPIIFLFDDASVQSVLPRYCTHLIESFEASVLEHGVFTAIAGVHELKNEGRIPHAMGHYVPAYDPNNARKETVPGSFMQYLSRAQLVSAGSSNTDNIVNAIASALLTASDMAGAAYGRQSRKCPHRQVVELLAETEGSKSYLALVDFILLRRGTLTPDNWHSAALPLAVDCVKQLSDTEILTADVESFLSWQQNDIPTGGEEILSQSTNLYRYPKEAPRVQIRLGSIHSVKGETHTATLVLDSFFHGHHLSELKPWLLGIKSGGSSVDRRGRTVSEGNRMLGRLKLHYVAMTRPTHLLCLAMRKDVFADADLELLIRRGWHIIDCCVP